MKLFDIAVRVLVILAADLLMAMPFVLEFCVFLRDKEKKISYKRFRVVIYTVIYIIGITAAMYLLKETILWLEGLSAVKWLVSTFALSGRTVYCGKVFVAVLVNAAVGVLYIFFGRFVRLGLARKDLLHPKKKNGDFTWRQKAERRVIGYFHTEAWFIVARILGYLSATLSALYILIFSAYLAVAMFGVSWLPYSFISMLFDAGYIYPAVTLLGLFAMYFFLEGIRLVEDECPELLDGGNEKTHSLAADLEAVDAEVRARFRGYYACDVDMSFAESSEACAPHCRMTEYIAQAVENDTRDPQKRKEAYLNCIDRLVEGEKGVLINGSFFSGFSMYFLRYLSAVIARGDNVIFICNSDSEIDSVYEYLNEGFSEISSLYCEGAGAVDLDDPIWRIVRVSGERCTVDEAAVEDNSILVTSLDYLCSDRFRDENSRFFSMVDAVVFVDTLTTVNTFNRQMSVLNTRIKQMTVKNSLASKNGDAGDMFGKRYMSRCVRYICFDSSRVAGLDKVLKNMLMTDFDSVDAMSYGAETMVRCYKYEGDADGDAGRPGIQFVNSEERLGVVFNMAVLCLAKGASSVSVFTDDIIPYGNSAEIIAANAAQLPDGVKVDESRIRVNRYFYDPDDYSVIIAMDSGDNLPATVRKYASMVSGKPVLLIVFSKPYMLRDHYIGDMDGAWLARQVERIPVDGKTLRDAAESILVRANAGGAFRTDIMRLASGVPELRKYAADDDLNAILIEVLRVYGIRCESPADLFGYFEYTVSSGFDESGKFNPDEKIILKRGGSLFDMINGRDPVIMKAGDRDIALPVPRRRLSHNYIAGQNLVHNGNIYHIRETDAAAGVIEAELAAGGKNDEVYRYLQTREYRVDLAARSGCREDHIQPEHGKNGDVSVSDVYISSFRAPMEVLTSGYYDIDPRTLSVVCGKVNYHNMGSPEEDRRAAEAYRRYGEVSGPVYPAGRQLSADGAMMLCLRICGNFGGDSDKTAALAAAMLNELLRSVFPGVSDALAVCPVLHCEPTGDDAAKVMKKQPRLTVIGDAEEVPSGEIRLLIIEDSAEDLGVVSGLVAAGNVPGTLFAPILGYLDRYKSSERKKSYLYYGLGHEPGCFDFTSLGSLAGLLGDSGDDTGFVDLRSVTEYTCCDFCGRRFSDGNELVKLEDDRKMCRSCAEHLVGNSRKTLRAHLDHARAYLEEVYGITVGDDYRFCFESTAGMIRALKHSRNISRRGADVPLRSYISGKKVYAEYTLPSASLSELLVRELTHVWQLNHLPQIDDELAEGLIALVSVQYLTFAGQRTQADARTKYYESTGNDSGVGYRRLVAGLRSNPQFGNNPFRYLLEEAGVPEDDIVSTDRKVKWDENDYGLPYSPEQPDRALDGNIKYFYYTRLTSTMQRAYDAMLAAIRDHADTVTVEGCTCDDVFRVSQAIRYDHPELFWYKTAAVLGTTVYLKYGATAEEAEVLQRRIDEVTAKYLEGIDDSMSAYDVALRLYVKIVSNVDYDSLALTKQKAEGNSTDDKIDYLRTICGVLLDGKAVCEGYARGLQYLLQKCGVECAEAAGHTLNEDGSNGCGHAWNIIKIDGDYYYLDATWDDRSNTDRVRSAEYTFLDFFCITTEELLRSRKTDLCPADMPLCNAVRGNYHYHNDMVLENCDVNEIKRIAKAAARNKCSFFTLKCTSCAVRDRVCALWRDEASRTEVIKAIGRVNKKIYDTSWVFNRASTIWTFTVNFKERKKSGVAKTK